MMVHPDNTLARYTMALPQHISLCGWDCGLAEVRYLYRWYNVRSEDTWSFLNETVPTELTPSTKIHAGNYHGLITSTDHPNKVLKRIWTDRVRPKVNDITITQTMKLHMSTNTEFTVPYQRVMGTVLGFQTSIDTTQRNGYTDPTLGRKDPCLTPSATVTLPPKRTPGGLYLFRKEANIVVNMTQGFDTVHSDVVESPIVCDSLVPFLRTFSIRRYEGTAISDRSSNNNYGPLL